MRQTEMDRRTQILMSAFAVLVGAGLVRGVVYPSWIHPLLTIDERITERRKVLEKLEAEEAAVQQARHEYKALVARVGSFDVGRVETEVRDRLNRLIEKHHLQEASVSPSRAVEERKTGLWSTAISVSATGTLESSIAFLRDLVELPQLVRVGNPALSPVGGSRKGLKQDLISLRVPVELLVLPQNQVAGRIVETDLPHADAFPRHQGRNYAEIWNKKPFSDYVPPVPLRATVARPVNVEKGQPATLIPEKIVLQGEIPSAARVPSGCAFHPRCYARIEGCGRILPELLAVAPAHHVRCILYDPAHGALGLEGRPGAAQERPPAGVKGEANQS